MPEADPITESIPHLGHSAVFASSTHAEIAAGEKVSKQ